MSTSVQKFLSQLRVDSMPPMSTVPITEDQHRLRRANGQLVAPTQVIVESGIEWERRGTGIILKNKTPDHLKDITVLLAYHEEADSVEDVSGAEPIKDLTGLVGKAMIPLQPMYWGKDTHTDFMEVDPSEEVISTFPEGVFKITKLGVIIPRGIWKISANAPCSDSSVSIELMINNSLQNNQSCGGYTEGVYRIPESSKGYDVRVRIAFKDSHKDRYVGQGSIILEKWA